MARTKWSVMCRPSPLPSIFSTSGDLPRNPLVQMRSRSSGATPLPLSSTTISSPTSFPPRGPTPSPRRTVRQTAGLTSGDAPPRMSTYLSALSSTLLTASERTRGSAMTRGAPGSSIALKETSSNSAMACPALTTGAMASLASHQPPALPLPRDTTAACCCSTRSSCTASSSPSPPAPPRLAFALSSRGAPFCSLPLPAAGLARGGRASRPAREAGSEGADARTVASIGKRRSTSRSDWIRMSFASSRFIWSSLGRRRKSSFPNMRTADSEFFTWWRVSESMIRRLEAWTASSQSLR
mmetsp:Transcript_62428/g.143033  ORF Transcript_62428/g.143033 Transcript_62428/m.143033 type:complete len:297 (-) Transcript_62428:82-972(-)